MAKGLQLRTISTECANYMKMSPNASRKESWEGTTQPIMEQRTISRRPVYCELVDQMLRRARQMLATHPPDGEFDMAYDESLAGRVEDALSATTGIVKKGMFGVACYMRDGNAFAGVWDDSLIVRTGPEDYEAALAEPFVREFDITGKPMTGWVVVGPDGIDEDSSLRDWLNRAMEFARTLPRKPRLSR